MVQKHKTRRCEGRHEEATRVGNKELRGQRFKSQKTGDAASQKKEVGTDRGRQIRSSKNGVVISGLLICAVSQANFGQDTTHPKFCAYLKLEFSTDLSEFSSRMTFWNN